MRWITLLISIMMIFTGCKNADSEMNRAISVRNKLLNGNGCCFDSLITADYSNKVTSFTVSCEFDRSGNMLFSVKEPDSICGISGNVSEEGGTLTFDDELLGFELLADGQLSPISAPWVLIKSLRSGYFKACSSFESGLYLIIDDIFAEKALQINLWTNNEDLPRNAEIVYEGRRILSIEIQNFVYL